MKLRKLLSFFVGAMIPSLIACGGGTSECTRTDPGTVVAAPAEHEHFDGKPQAPVGVDVVFEGTVAHVRVHFMQAGSRVAISAHGIRGMAIKGDGVLATGAELRADETVSYDLDVVPGAGETMLVVSVRGEFAAGERVSVRAFPIGTADKAPKPKTTRVGDDELRIVPTVEDHH